MPELPEVEVTRRGLAPAVVGKVVTGALVRVPKLRSPVPDLAECLSGKKLVSLGRRAKYLVWTFEGKDGKRAWLVTHMGMSGSWRIWPAPAPEPHRHDHIDIDFGDTALRYTDPRRFGDFRWFERDPYDEEPLRSLGKEPWDEAVTPSWFLSELKKTSRPVKEVLLSGTVVVGCGNIYSSEALFEAGIRPTRRADRISAERAEKLLAAIRDVLSKAIASGGSTLHDFHGPEGETGWFPLACAVYGREGGNCPKCGAKVKRIEQGGRSTFFCPHCQH